MQPGKLDDARSKTRFSEKERQCGVVNQAFSTWGTPLVDRIDRPVCGCSRRFDPVSRTEVSNCQQHPPTLFYLCRNFLLKVIGLRRLGTLYDPKQLQMPAIVVRDICHLRVSDFYINPFKVQTKDINDGMYRARTSFSGLEVLLQVSKTKRPQETKRTPDFLTTFEDQGLTCVVWEPTLTLQEMLKIHTRLGQPLAYSFIWKIVQDISAHIVAFSTKSHIILNPAYIKISKSNGSVYVCQKQDFELDEVNKGLDNPPKPPEANSLLYGYIPEKAHVWTLGYLLLDMVTIGLVPGKVRGGSSRVLISKERTYEDKLKLVRGLPDNALKDIIERSLNEHPSKRPRAKEIFIAAQDKLKTGFSL